MIADVTSRQPVPSPADTESALELRRFEREAEDVRRAFAGDPTVRLVVGLDLAIRRAAIRLRETCRALWPSAAAGRRQGHPTRS